VEAGNVVVGADGSCHEVDAIVFATGFTPGATMLELQVKGLGGRCLQQDWAKKQRTYLGLAVAGYPNAFIILGPNTTLGHNSMVFMAECQVNYILQMLLWMQRDQLKWVTVRTAAMDAFNERLQQRLQHRVWLSGGCNSWYLRRLQDSRPAGAQQQVPDAELVRDQTKQQQQQQQQQQARRLEGYVMWPWSTIRFWWEMLWPNKAHWSSVKE
jgi:hypothetical protein